MEVYFSESLIVLSVFLGKILKMVSYKLQKRSITLKEAVTGKVHSLSSGQVEATPILKSVPSQFSPFILQITVSLHAYKTILAQSQRQRENYSNLLSLDG